MNRPSSSSVRLVLSGLVFVLVCMTQGSRVHAGSGACDVSGQYTDRLCERDHLVPGSYISSDNYQFRFYFQSDGHALVWDVSDYENWQFVDTVAFPYPWASPGAYFMYGATSADGAPGFFDTYRINWLQATYYWGGPSTADGSYWTETPVGDHYVKLDNDGCLRIYDDNGLVAAMSTC